MLFRTKTRRNERTQTYKVCFYGNLWLSTTKGRQAKRKVSTTTTTMDQYVVSKVQTGARTEAYGG